MGGSVGACDQDDFLPFKHDLDYLKDKLLHLAKEVKKLVDDNVKYIHRLEPARRHQGLAQG